MNKLRLIKIYELKGKIHPIDKFVIELLDNIDITKTDDLIYYKKDNVVYLIHNLTKNNIWLNLIIYRTFGEKIKCLFEEKREIMKYLLEKHLKITINELR